VASFSDKRKQIRISLIIPAYNEEDYLPRLLRTVSEARKRYRYGPEAVEVIVVDNISSDETPHIANDFGASVVREERHIIAAVRNTGARAARGKFLAFVDADSRIHPQTFNIIDSRLSHKRVIAGTTGVQLERWSLGIFITYVIIVLMVWILRMDTGVVFCRRADFEAMGGYKEDKRVAEDVQFLFDLRRLGRERGQRLVRATEVKAIASTRKFDRHGEWYHLSLIWRFLYGVITRRDNLDEIADLYWYNR
jgi:glycosyltransferase involved in cell wall biosynthesis